MFKLQRLNVIRKVESEAQKQNLISQGFKDITPKQQEKAPENPAPVDYNSYTLDDLKQLAKDREIQGYSNMKKEDLITVLKGLESEKK